MSPMLFQMSADGTPRVVFKQHSSRLSSGKVVHRKAKQTEKFFVRNQFVRSILPDGHVGTRVVVHDPVPLKHWKSAHATVKVLRRDGKNRATVGPLWVLLGFVSVTGRCIGEVVHIGADPSDFQHLSYEVLEHAMASLHGARVALSEGQEERTSDFRTRVPGRTRHHDCKWLDMRRHARLRWHWRSQGLLRTARPLGLDAYQPEGFRRPRRRSLSVRVERPTFFHEC